MSSWKEQLRDRAPWAYRLLRAVYVRTLIEYKVLRQLRPSRLLTALSGRREAWQAVLPLQRVLRVEVPGSTRWEGDLEATLREWGLGAETGGHAVYLSPAAWQRSPLAALAQRYPADAGLKLMRNPGGIAEGEYVHGDGHSTLHVRALYGHRHLTLVANYFAQAGLGVRLYDLLEVSLGGVSRVAYVVQHAPGGEVPPAECERGIARLAELVRGGELEVIAPGGLAHHDFTCPTCNGNARLGSDGRFRYVDIQNFTLTRYERYLRRTAETAAEATHFGDKSVLRGGAYLYQAVPGLDMPAKRDPARRIPVLTRLLAEAGGSIEDRVVLDVGCNIGMMIGQYLSLGARWCHGWDRATVAPHTDKVLSALGCTRYSVTGGDITRDKDLAADLSPHVRGMLDRCIISYLAVRLHLGWLDALATLPWQYLMYEGHEGEDVARTRQFLTEFQGQVPCEITGIAEYQDGDSDPRVVAVLKRMHQA